MTIRIGNGAGFFGDNVDAPRLLVEAGELDYLTLEYLAELTLSILARQREKNPQSGYAGDFLQVLASLHPSLKQQPKLRIVTNAGGMNPVACAQAAAKQLVQAGLGELPVAVVTGDDLLPAIERLQQAGVPLANLDTGAPLAECPGEVVSANAYLGAVPIVEALAAEARLVITGRVADASLTLGPAIYEFGWSMTDWPRLAGGTVAGHLIECGAQVTGGYSADWQNYNLAQVGYPIAELAADGTCVITKTVGSGGRVDRATVSEQLVYEIGDPKHYLTPDVDVNFTGVEIEELGVDRVAVRGAQGAPAPESYKVSLAYRAGYTAAGQLLVYGRDCLEKARACGEMILERVRLGGFDLDHADVELLGTGEAVPGVHVPLADPREVMLRMSVRDLERAAVERFAQELAPLITSGPAGLAGYAAGRPNVRPVFAYWPTLVPKDMVQAKVEVRTAKKW